MLNALRKTTSGIVAKILLGLLALSLGVWGIADVFVARNVETVVTAGEAEVSIGDYALAYGRARAPIEQQLGRRLTSEETALFGIDQAVLGQLTSGAILDAQVADIGLGLSEDQLAREIASDPNFQDSSGNFSRATFRNLLANIGVSEGVYIESQGKAATRGQIVDAVTGGVGVPDIFRDALGLHAGERRTVEYVTLAPALVEPVPAPDEAALQAYFDENRQTYAAPEYRGIDYALLTPDALADPEGVADEAIQADYDANIDSFRTPERRRVAQIVFPDRPAADAARARLDSGVSFADVTAEAGRTAADTDLGLLSRAELPDTAVAEAAFALPLGGASPVVEGGFGPVIVTVTEIQAEATRPLAEVSDEIRNDLALSVANDEAIGAYQTFEDARAGGATLAEAASASGLTQQTIMGIDPAGNAPDGQPVADFPGLSQLVDEAFQTDQGIDNVPISLGSNGYVFYEVTRIEPARERELDEVRERVVADWTAGERTRLLDERVASLQAEAEGGAPLADIAAGIGSAVSTAPSITRQSGGAELGQAATAAAFSGGPGLVTTAPAADGAGRLLMRVTEVAPPADPAASVPAGRLPQIETAMENDLFSSYVADLQGLYPVRVYPEAIEQAKAASR